MVAITLDLDVSKSVAAYLSRLPRAEQNRIVRSAITGAFQLSSEGEMGDKPHPNATALLSQAVLAEDWERPEEDVAWSHLQSAR